VKDEAEALARFLEPAERQIDVVLAT
jgi:hypothetical protein